MFNESADASVEVSKLKLLASYDTQIIIIMMHKLCCMRAESRITDHERNSNGSIPSKQNQAFENEAMCFKSMN